VALPAFDFFALFTNTPFFFFFFFFFNDFFFACNALSQTKGTASKGKKNHKTHIPCRRCNEHSYHIQKARCASCGYPSAKMRKYNWATKAGRRRTQGTGRMRFLKNAATRAKHNFREGTVAKAIKKGNPQKK
jgi:large subunit ribosomal protein L37e